MCESGGACVMLCGAEDAPAPQIAAEAVDLPVAREVTIHHLGRHVLELLQAIGGMTGGGQRLLVHVGAVDLDQILAGPIAEMLGQEHGDRVGLLARRTPRAPDPNGPGVSSALQELGE